MARFEMINPSEWDDEVLLRTHVANALNDSRVAVVLGAGLSQPLKLPDWSELIRRLYAAQSMPVPSTGTLPQKAEYLFNAKFKGRPEDANKAVSTALYEGFTLDFQTLRRNETMAALGSLVMSSVRGRATSVITFNFDDLLEAYLEFHGFVVDSVSDDRHLTTTADAVVYHPHGMLPVRPGVEPSTQIVFDRKRYNEIIGDDKNLWRQALVSLLRTRLCLFIGLSGDDDNLDSMLLRVNDVHGYRDSRAAFWGIRFTVDIDEVADASWKERGVYTKRLRSYDDLPAFLFGICQAAAQNRGRRP